MKTIFEDAINLPSRDRIRPQHYTRPFQEFNSFSPPASDKLASTCKVIKIADPDLYDLPLDL